MADPEVQRIVQAVSESRKYRSVAPRLIAHLAELEVSKSRRFREAVKEVKNRLHQTVGAYVEETPDYDVWLARLQAADTPDARRAVCLDLLGAHASSHERLNILPTFYETLLGDLPPIRSVIDVACGLNPLAIPWMPLAKDAHYVAIDALDDLAIFLEEALPLFGVSSRALSDDVTLTAPIGTFDVALIIKAIPCLQQIDRSTGSRLLKDLDAACIVVSYPVRSLGGNDKGMRDAYAASFMNLIGAFDWRIERFDFADELAFRVFKTPRVPEA
ncbi:MAG: 16S rRNA methyltransferase [Anaerolineae bacterium]|nr:16S rRNA methyltransferase [Anaerolineae bacterium]NUQ02433.1 16S rRNA methyltransferase [Anaerolineae bacterium]